MLKGLDASEADKQALATELGEYYNNPIQDKYTMGDQMKAIRNGYIK